MLVFLFLAFAAAFASSQIGKHRLRTPWVANLLGSFCIWASVFSLGGALGGSGPWSPSVDEPLDLSPYTTAAKYLALAVLAYGGAYFLQRALAKRHARKGSN